MFKHSTNKNIPRLIWYLNLRITGCVFDKTKYGWLFYFSQITDTSLLKQLDIFSAKQLTRFGILSSKSHTKKFMRTYYEITKNFSRTSYIPKFDRYTLSQKRALLKEVFDVDKKRMSPQEIERDFRHKILKQIKELEQNLARQS